MTEQTNSVIRTTLGYHDNRARATTTLDKPLLKHWAYGSWGQLFEQFAQQRLQNPAFQNLLETHKAL